MLTQKIFRGAARLRDDTSGLALLEFAFSLPLVLGIGLYGAETANLALANLRVSQIALNLADNASRVGVDSGLATQQLREVDITDVLYGAVTQGAAFDIGNRGRIILSSLENNNGVQSIHWQRCIGKMKGADWESHYGTTTITDGTTTNAADDGTLAPDGMGPDGGKVNAPNNSGVMFVEVNYDYKPVISTQWLPGGSARVHYIASFIVRDRRDFSMLFNPSPRVSPYTCNKYLAS